MKVQPQFQPANQQTDRLRDRRHHSVIPSTATNGEILDVLRESQSWPLAHQAIARPDEQHMQDRAREDRPYCDRSVRLGWLGRRTPQPHSALEAEDQEITRRSPRGKFQWQPHLHTSQSLTCSKHFVTASEAVALPAPSSSPRPSSREKVFNNDLLNKLSTCLTMQKQKLSNGLLSKLSALRRRPWQKARSAEPRARTRQVRATGPATLQAGKGKLCKA